MVLPSMIQASLQDKTTMLLYSSNILSQSIDGAANARGSLASLMARMRNTVFCQDGISALPS